MDEQGKLCRCNRVPPHCFDPSRSGYLNLEGGRHGEGDGKAAVRARRAFLDAGYYQPLSDDLNGLLGDLGASLVLDAGCGEGYYTNRMASGRDVLGIDLSKEGVDLAAKKAKAEGTRASFCVASLFSLPIKDQSFDVVTNLFAPCAEEEFLRVLKDGGYLILVGAGAEHLMGLKRVLYDMPRKNLGREDLPRSMELVATHRVRYPFTVKGREEIEALFSMTPYYWRTSKADRAKLEPLEELTAEADFDVFMYRKGGAT